MMLQGRTLVLVGAAIVLLLGLSRGLKPIEATQQVVEVDPIVYQQHCSEVNPGSATVIFLWSPSGQGPQWLDISLSAEDFAPGTFLGIGPFGPNTFAFTWEGILSGRTHYFRVNTATSVGWVPSRTLTFKSAECTPGSVGVDPGLTQLQLSLQNTITGYGLQGQFALAVTDLQTGETVSVNGLQPMLSGCTINLLGIMQTTVDLQNGLYPESLVGSLISQTIYSSNPVTARSLYEISGGGDTMVGVGKTQGLIRNLGLSSTVLDHPPGYLGVYGFGASNLITAEDANLALAKLYRGEVVGTFWRDYLLFKMQEVKAGLNYLVGATPGGTVSHKNGFLWESGWADNDVGIVRFQSGNLTYAYSVSFYSQYVPGKYDEIPMAQDLMRLIWVYFDATY